MKRISAWMPTLLLAQIDVLRCGVHAFVGGTKAHVPEGVGGVDRGLIWAG